MKRFYANVTLEPIDASEGSMLRLTLDGRSVKTPAKTEVLLTPGPYADVVKAEWEAQGDEIRPHTMPLTRLTNTVIDGVTPRRNDVASDVIAYGNSDLICYWADAPADLVARQEQHWRPVLNWATEYLKANFKTVTGVVAIEQDENAIIVLAVDINKLDNYALAALHEMTTITGSVLISLAVVRGALNAEAAWEAAHLDEAHQTALWGTDDEAAARLEGRKGAFMSAVRALTLLDAIGT